MRLQEGHVLLWISAEEKQKVFEEEITGANGIKLTVFLQNPEEGDTDAHYGQSVSVAEVKAVAGDVKHIQPGDIAIIDYLVDTDSMLDRLVYQDEHGKMLCIDSRTTFHTEDNVVSAGLRSRTDQTVWEAGDVDQASLIYAVARGGQLIANKPYIICEHRDFRIKNRTADGLEYQCMDENTTVMRRVLVTNEDTDPSVAANDFVVVERYALYERSLEGRQFDVIMNRDIELLFEKN